MVNIRILSTPSGFLKVAHVVFGAIAVGISGHYFKGVPGQNKFGIWDKSNMGLMNETFSFELVNFGFLLPSFLLLVTFLIDPKADGIKKSLFEILYHCLGFVFIFSADVAYLALLGKTNPEFRRGTAYGLLMTAGVLALLNSLAYAANAFTAFKLRSGS